MVDTTHIAKFMGGKYMCCKKLLIFIGLILVTGLSESALALEGLPIPQDCKAGSAVMPAINAEVCRALCGVAEKDSTTAGTCIFGTTVLYSWSPPSKPKSEPPAQHKRDETVAGTQINPIDLNRTWGANGNEVIKIPNTDTAFMYDGNLGVFKFDGSDNLIEGRYGMPNGWTLVKEDLTGKVYMENGASRIYLKAKSLDKSENLKDYSWKNASSSCANKDPRDAKNKGQFLQINKDEMKNLKGLHTVLSAESKVYDAYTAELLKGKPEVSKELNAQCDGNMRGSLGFKRFDAMYKQANQNGNFVCLADYRSFSALLCAHNENPTYPMQITNKKVYDKYSAKLASGKSKINIALGKVTGPLGDQGQETCADVAPSNSITRKLFACRSESLSSDQKKSYSRVEPEFGLDPPLNSKSAQLQFCLENPLHTLNRSGSLTTRFNPITNTFGKDANPNYKACMARQCDSEDSEYCNAVMSLVEKDKEATNIYRNQTTSIQEVDKSKKVPKFKKAIAPGNTR